MKKIVEDIIALIAKRSGSTKKDTVKIITELNKIFKESSFKEHASKIPGISDASSGYTNITSLLDTILLRHIRTDKNPLINSQTLNDPDNVKYFKGASDQSVVFQHYNSVRQNIITELNSNSKSDEILGRF